jgi:tetratricopeptide (TPR) repeat protein
MSKIDIGKSNLEHPTEDTLARRQVPISELVTFVGFADEPVEQASQRSNLTASSSQSFEDSSVAKEELVAAARMAQDQKDWPGALAGWSAVRKQSPLEWAGYVGEARALRELRRVDEAAALLRDASQRFPDHVGVLHDLARLAEIQGNWSEAERSWSRYIALDPSPWWAHTSLANVLWRQGRISEAAALLVAAQEQLPQEIVVFVDHARLAEAQRDWEAALARWQVVCVRFPNEWIGHGGVAAALRELGRTDDLKAFLAAAAERFQEEVGLLIDWARLMAHGPDWSEAERCFSLLRQRFPNEPFGYVGALKVLNANRKWIEVERIIAEAKEKFPKHSALYVEAISLAVERGDHEQAAAHAQNGLAELPEDPAILGAYGAVLRAAGKFDEADELFDAALSRFPNDYAMLSIWVSLAWARGNWAEATRRVEIYRERHPDESKPLYHMSVILTWSGDFDKADRLLAEAIERFPRDSGMWASWVDISIRRENWNEAMDRCEKFLDKFPDNGEARLRMARVLSELGDTVRAETLLIEDQLHRPNLPAAFIDLPPI